MIKRRLLLIVCAMHLGFLVMANAPTLPAYDDPTFALDGTQGDNCRQVGKQKIKVDSLQVLFNNNRDDILRVAKENYPEADYLLLKKFFEKTYPKEKSRVYTIPCNATKILLKGKVCWIVNFRWEIPPFAMDGYIVLGHVNAYILDGKTGKIIERPTCG